MQHSIIWYIVIGFVIGLIAKMIVPGNDPRGFIMSIIIGIAGSFAGTWLGRVLHFYGPGQNAGFIGSLIGAIILLIIYHILRPKSQS